METLESFNNRVIEATGFCLNDLPRRSASIYDFGNIVAKRANVYVVTVGYPNVDLDNNETYDNFEIVVLV
jgi:hypothetical protein